MGDSKTSASAVGPALVLALAVFLATDSSVMQQVFTPPPGHRGHSLPPPPPAQKLLIAVGRQYKVGGLTYPGAPHLVLPYWTDAELTSEYKGTLARGALVTATEQQWQQGKLRVKIIQTDAGGGGSKKTPAEGWVSLLDDAGARTIDLVKTDAEVAEATAQTEERQIRIAKLKAEADEAQPCKCEGGKGRQGANSCGPWDEDGVWCFTGYNKSSCPDNRKSGQFPGVYWSLEACRPAKHAWLLTLTRMQRLSTAMMAAAVLWAFISTTTGGSSSYSTPLLYPPTLPPNLAGGESAPKNDRGAAAAKATTSTPRKPKNKKARSPSPAASAKSS